MIFVLLAPEPIAVAEVPESSQLVDHVITMSGFLHGPASNHKPVVLPRVAGLIKTIPPAGPVSPILSFSIFMALFSPLVELCPQVVLLDSNLVKFRCNYRQLNRQVARILFSPSFQGLGKNSDNYRRNHKKQEQVWI